ncbi:hypothetical protein NDU88_005775 [Pleurodeles waltl]|uniref:Uncharacterized protein n=1 Tax=Pleurodeles waltl TaxID=8319 RepID=A0AAV7NR72_PLEWA|nr:hypothetical protein NDU88_005775 [Pleurodeles waltl]
MAPAPLSDFRRSYAMAPWAPRRPRGLCFGSSPEGKQPGPGGRPARESQVDAGRQTPESPRSGRSCQMGSSAGLRPHRRAHDPSTQRRQTPVTSAGTCQPEASASAPGAGRPAPGAEHAARRVRVQHCAPPGCPSSRLVGGCHHQGTLGNA